MTALVERVVWVSLATSLLLLPLLGLSGAIRRRYRAGIWNCTVTRRWWRDRTTASAAAMDRCSCRHRQGA